MKSLESVISFLLLLIAVMCGGLSAAQGGATGTADSRAEISVPLFRMDPLCGYFLHPDDGQIRFSLIKQEHNDKFGADALDLIVRSGHERGALVFQDVFPDDGVVAPTHQASVASRKFTVPIPRRGVYYVEIGNSPDCAFGLGSIPGPFVVRSPVVLYDKMSVERAADLYFQPVAGDFSFSLLALHRGTFDCRIIDSDRKERGHAQLDATGVAKQVALHADAREVGSFWRIHLPVMDVRVVSDRIRYFSLEPPQYFDPEWKEAGELFLRGKHTAYLVAMGETLTVELAKYDINLYDGPDEMVLGLFTAEGALVEKVRIPDFDDIRATGVRYNTYPRHDFEVSPGRIYRLDLVPEDLDFNYDLRTNASRMVLQAGNLMLNERLASLRLYFYAPAGGFAIDAAETQDPLLDRHIMRLWDARERLLTQILFREGRRQVHVPPEEVGQVWALEIPSQAIELRTEGISAFAVDPDQLMRLPENPAAGPHPAVSDKLLDTTPPETFLVGPPEFDDGRVTFRFGGADLHTKARNLQYICTLGQKRVRAEEAEIRYVMPRRGRHTFQVQAVDAVGNIDPSPATLSFRVPGRRMEWWVIGGALLLAVAGVRFWWRRRRTAHLPTATVVESGNPIQVSLHQLLQWCEQMRNQWHRLRNQLPLMTESPFIEAVLEQKNMQDVENTRERLRSLQKQLQDECYDYPRIAELSAGGRTMVEWIRDASELVDVLDKSIIRLARASEQQGTATAIAIMTGIHARVEPRLARYELPSQVCSEIALAAWLPEFTRTCDADVRIDGDATLTTDTEALGHAVLNLLRNATEAEATRIEIYLREQADEVELALHDNGRGIPPDILSQIQAGTCVTTKTTGAGIGLQDVRNIVSYLGGRWTIESEGTDQGCAVRILLPRV